MFDLIEKKNIFFIFSGLVLVAGIVSILLFGFQRDIDFKGGTSLTIDIGKEFNNEDIRNIVNKDVGTNLTSVQKSGAKNTEVVIKTASNTKEVSLNDEQRTKVINDLKEKYGFDAKTAVKSTEKIDASVGQELSSKSFWAAVIASLLMLLYITIRFEFLSGISAVVALVHDVLLMFAVYSIFRIPISTSFVVAILTVFGYSITDTIVVFDRIRENLRITRKEDFGKLVNRSIWQTMTRSINTVLTVLITLSCLYILGVPAIREFTLPLLVGIVSGAYSSIFIASPVWVLLRAGETKRIKFKSA